MIADFFDGLSRVAACKITDHRRDMQEDKQQNSDNQHDAGQGSAAEKYVSINFVCHSALPPSDPVFFTDSTFVFVVSAFSFKAFMFS